jgi:hypothetical protein
MLRRMIIIDTACIIGPMQHHPTTTPPLELLFTVFKSTRLPLSELRSHGVGGDFYCTTSDSNTRPMRPRKAPTKALINTIITPLFEPFPSSLNQSITPLHCCCINLTPRPATTLAGSADEGESPSDYTQTCRGPFPPRPLHRKTSHTLLEHTQSKAPLTPLSQQARGPA